MPRTVNPPSKNKPVKEPIHKVATCWLRKDNIWTEVGFTRQGQPAANRLLVAGFSCPSRLVCRQPSPRGSTRKTPGCQIGRSVGEKGGALFFLQYNESIIHKYTFPGRDLKYQKHFFSVLVWMNNICLCVFSAGTLASKSNITYEPCGIFTLGHLPLYCSSVNATKTTAGQEPALPAARNHTSMTTSSAPTQVWAENKLSTAVLSCC